MATPVLGAAIPGLPSGNIEITEQFFADKLGFETVAKYPAQKFLIMRRGAAEIHFWQAPTEEYARNVARESSCYIRVENIGPLFEEFKKRIAPFRYQLEKKPWGMNEMQIDDPYGNAIRFGEA
jgi:catechol 2,3-dioxygenase-like lactoylglutathione lyase family enzyme